MRIAHLLLLAVPLSISTPGLCAYSAKTYGEPAVAQAASPFLKDRVPHEMIAKRSASRSVKAARTSRSQIPSIRSRSTQGASSNCQMQRTDLTQGAGTQRQAKADCHDQKVHSSAPGAFTFD